MSLIIIIFVDMILEVIHSLREIHKKSDKTLFINYLLLQYDLFYLLLN